MVFPCLSSEFDVFSENTSFFRGDFPATEFQPFQPPGPGFDDHPFMTGKLLLLILVCMAPAAWLGHRGMPKGLELGPSWWVCHPQVKVFLAACSSGHQFYSCFFGGVQFHQFLWVIKCYKTIVVIGAPYPNFWR